jgi:lysophospholipase L1-like esterase
MIQIFILGSSSAYGVGAQTSGWGDLVKQYYHDKMYAAGGVGEKYEVFNFGKSGATIDFVTAAASEHFKHYGRGGEVITIFSVGGNNSKAEDRPDNFVSTVEEYTAELEAFITLLKQHSTKIIGVGHNFVDESKTNPKHNPLTGGASYFSNERRSQFGEATKALCQKHGVLFAEVGGSQDEWIQKYLYEDGLHPNQEGHRLIFESIRKHLED